MCTKDNMKSDAKQMKKEATGARCRIGLISFSAAALLILLLCSFAGSAAAGEITVIAPPSPVSAGETITLPVVMTGAEDIAGITFEVANNVPGVTITISKSRPLEGGSYLFNSKPENPVQKVVWYSPYGVSGESVEMFSLDVVVSSSAAASIPIVITPVTIVNSSSGFLTDQYPVSSAEIQLTNTTIGKVMMGSEEPQPSQTAAPTQAPSPTETTAPASTPVPTETATPTSTPVPTQSAPQSTSVIPGTPQAQPIKTASAASPLGLLPLIGLAAAFIIGRKERIL